MFSEQPTIDLSLRCFRESKFSWGGRPDSGIFLSYFLIETISSVQSKKMNLNNNGRLGYERCLEHEVMYAVLQEKLSTKIEAGFHPIQKIPVFTS